MIHTKKLLYIVGFCVTLLLSGLSLFQLSKSRTFQFFGGLVAQVATTKKVVALTFDDAPTIHTDEVLQLLADKEVKATFYLIGNNIKQYPQQAQAINNAGHEIGNHSYSHVRLVLKSLDFIRNEIQKTSQLIRDIGYTGEITFRPPNGKKLLMLPWYLHSIKMKTIMWNIEPDTYYQGNASMIESHVVNTVKPGSIIVMHPFCDKLCEADRQALPHIIDRLKADGYTFVTIHELLDYAQNR